MAASGSAVITSFLVNLAIFFGCFLVFSLLRPRRWLRRFFAPRRYASDLDLKPKRLGKGIFSWIIPVLRYKEEDIIDECGLDAMMYLRVLRLGCYLFIGVTTFCMITVLPVNLSGNEVDTILAQSGSQTVPAPYPPSPPMRPPSLPPFPPRPPYPRFMPPSPPTAPPSPPAPPTSPPAPPTSPPMPPTPPPLPPTPPPAPPEPIDPPAPPPMPLPPMMPSMPPPPEIQNATITVNGKEYKFSNFDKCSLANIPSKSNLMWVHLVSLYVVSTYTLWLLGRFNRESVLLRLMFLGNAKRGGPSHTVLVSDIPGVSDVVSKARRAERRARGGASKASKGPRRQGLWGLKGSESVDEGADSEDGDSEIPGSRSVDPGKQLQLSPLGQPPPPPPPLPPPPPPAPLPLPAPPTMRRRHGPAAGPVAEASEDPPSAPAPEGPTAAGAAPGPATAPAAADAPAAPPAAPALAPAPAPAPEAAAAAPPTAATAPAPAVLQEEGEAHPAPAAAAEEPSAAAAAAPAAAGPEAAAPAAEAEAEAAAGSSEDAARVAPAAAAAAAAVTAGAAAAAAVVATSDAAAAGAEAPVANGTPAAAAAAPTDATVYDAAAEHVLNADGIDMALSPDDIDATYAAAVAAAAVSPAVATAAVSAFGQLDAQQQVAAAPDAPQPAPSDQVAIAMEATPSAAAAGAGAVTAVGGSATLHPTFSSGSAPKGPSRRLTKRYNYDLADETLDPAYKAKKRLKATGMSPEEFVYEQFALVYGREAVAAVNMVMDTFTLDPLTTEYNALRQQLEDTIDKIQFRMKLRKEYEFRQTKVLGAKYGEWGERTLGTKKVVKMDEVEWLGKRLRYLREEIIRKQASASKKVWPTAFVTFNTRMAQAVGSAALFANDVKVWRVKGAPAPFELVWGNLGVTLPVRSSRNIIVWILFWLMVLFFMIPVAAIQALIQAPTLSGSGAVQKAPLKQIFQAIIPGLALKVFLAIVPLIIRVMMYFAGATSQSEIDFGVTKRFFLFQVVAVFFGSVISGAFFNQLKQWIDDPGSVIPILGKAIPMNATFFLTYLLINGLLVKSFQFLRLPGLIFFGILTKFAGSPKARQRVWMYQWTDNGRTTVDHTIALLLGLVFSCMNPVVCIGALLYFFAVMLGEAYNNIYVFRRAYESAGRLWKTVYNQVMAGLYLTQIVMICLMLVKEFKWAILGVPLVFITLLTHITTLNMYNRPWSVMALADAAELDVWETEARMLDDKRKARAKPGAALRAEEAKLTPGGASGTPLALATGTGSGSLLEAGGLSGAASGGTPVSPTVLKNILSLDLELTPEERAAVADTYKNPSFKVPLEDLDSLIAQAEDLRHRVTLLNKYSVELQAHEKKEKKALAERKKQARREKRKLTPEEGQLAPYDPPPPEITLFDAKPPLDASDDD